MKVWERLQELAEATETEAQALRIAAEKLQAYEHNRAQANGHKVITRAAAIRRKVKGTNGVQNKQAKTGKMSTGFVAVLGALSAGKATTRAELNTKLHTKDPKALNGSLGNLQRHGYIERTDDGYVLTGKEWGRK